MRDPDLRTYCPICGKAKHDHCSPRVYAAIDAANTRAWNAEDNPDDKIWNLPKQSFYMRLKEGFEIMSAAYDVDDNNYEFDEDRGTFRSLESDEV